MKHISLLALGVAGLAAGCDSAPIAPSATIVTVAPERLVPADDALDDLVITVEYSDGDGDLGGGIAQVVDCRADGLRTELPIPAIAPDPLVSDGAHIRGTLELHVNDIGELAPGVAPSVCRDLGVADVGGGAVFCVVLVDVAGHEGDGDCTPTIAISTE